MAKANTNPVKKKTREECRFEADNIFIIKNNRFSNECFFRPLDRRNFRIHSCVWACTRVSATKSFIPLRRDLSNYRVVCEQSKFHTVGK